MAGESPAAVLFDSLANPVGVVIDGLIYRLQVEAKVAAGSTVAVTQSTSPWVISAASLPLPTGAATESTLLSVDTGVGLIQSAIDVQLSTLLSTTAFQARINTLGQKVMAASTPVVLASDQSTLPVSIAATVAVSGPLTDAELRATPVPVSGTFFPATQPISAVSLPLPMGAATEATLALIKAKTDNLDVLLSSRAVTGLTDAQLRASAVPVSGTFFQATQPVSIASTVAISAVSLPLPTGAATQVTLASLLANTNTLGQKTMAGSMPVVLASDQGPIPITGTITASDASVGITGAAVPGSTQQNGGTDGVNLQPNHMFDLDSGAGTEYNLGISLRKRASGGSVELGTSSDPIRVDPTGTTTQPISGTVAISGSVPVTGTFFQATQPVSIAATVAVSAVSLPLPTGAATAALQTQPGVDIGDVTVNNAAGAAAVNIQDGGNSITVDGTVAISGSVAVTGPLTDAQLRATPVPVSATSLPLPTGAATEATLATRATEATSASILGQLDVLLSTRASEVTALTLLTTAAFQARINTLGQKVMASSTPVVLASDQASIPVTGPLTDAELRATPVPVSGTVTANQGGAPWSQNLTQVGGSAVTTIAAGELRVGVEGLAADGATPVGNPVLSAGYDGTNTQTLLTDTSGRQRVVGAAAQAAAVVGDPVLIAGEDAAGNVQRIRTAALPPVGTTPGAVVRPVVAQTGTTTSIGANTSNVTLLAANTARLGAVITNDGKKILYVKLGATASATSFTYKLLSGERTPPIDAGYTGIIDGIWDAVDGSARITELT